MGRTFREPQPEPTRMVNVGSIELYKRTKVREDNLLMYLETVCVDHGGQIDARKVNDAEIKWMEEWDDRHFIVFRRGPLLVALSDEAWEAAHRARREKAARVAERMKT